MDVDRGRKRRERYTAGVNRVNNVNNCNRINRTHLSDADVRPKFKAMPKAVTVNPNNTRLYE